MAEPVTYYKAKDDTVFESEAEADAHDGLADVTEQVKQFTAAYRKNNNYKPRFADSLVNHLVAWERFKATGHVTKQFRSNPVAPIEE